jgi:hydroxypyruvate isomerase
MERRFKLNYAPHLGLWSADTGMFREHAGPDPIDQIKFMSNQGFAALEDNWMRTRSVELQEKIGKELDKLGMQMGTFVATLETATSFGIPYSHDAVTFASDKEDNRERLLHGMRQAVEVAKRVNAKWFTVVSGRNEPRLPQDYQTANMIENLKRCADICETAGLVMAVEPINIREWPGTFLNTIPHTYQIVRAVNSPSCKLLFDMYHAQKSGGDIIVNIDKVWDEICYFQGGDNPGHNEPTTGEMNYQNLFRHIQAKGYTGVIGMEHGNSKPGKEGEQLVIDTYVALDNF